MDSKRYLPGTARERIQDLLKEKKITQAQLAKKIGCSESTMSRFLRGDTEKLGNDAVIAIADFFGVSADFILGITDDPSASDVTMLNAAAAEAAKMAVYENAGEMREQYSRTIDRMIDDLTCSGRKPVSGITKEELVDEILSCVSVLDFSYEERARLKEAFLPLFPDKVSADD